ncbi:polysaccharide biosynthesis tyrosine autokinase [Azospirillum sp. SYSU D00513]|uniref:GumC family protein n=1 Tax=Azospirillum sp. SYSU D00513 TaxID=2812561 RepID=UPI001A97B3BE|nr:polysaccharide biosynthesis tyrosine autokinase [Azospirillum sp. SYSU D00513]
MDAQNSRLPVGVTGPIAPPVGAEADKIDVKRLLQTLWRQKLLILTVIAILWIPTLLLIRSMTPLFTATAVVVIDPHPNRVINIPMVSDAMGIYLDTVNTEIEVLRSRDLARRVVEKTNLVQEPEYRRLLEPAGGTLTRLFGWLSGGAAFLPEGLRTVLAAQAPAPAQRLDEPQSLDLVTDVLLKKLTVSPAVQSRAIRVTFEAEDPKLAARIANAVVENYGAMQSEAKRAATIRASQWLQSQLEDLKTDMTETGQAAVDALRSETGLTRGRDGLLVAEEMSAVSAQLTEARSTYEASQAQLQQLLAIENGRGASGGPTIISNPLITALRQRQITANARLAELRQQYGDRHPVVVSATAELQNLNASVAGEIGRAVRNLRADVEQHFTRVQDLTKRLDDLRGRALSAMEGDVNVRQLQRMADASDDNYRRAITRLKETQVLQAMQMTPDIRVVTTASVPFAAVWPSKNLLAALSGFVYTALAVGVALVLVIMQRGLYSSHQVEALLGLPTLGAVPLLRRKQWTDNVRPLSCKDEKGAEFAEAIWRLCARMKLVGANGLSGSDERSEVIMIASSVASEGKTTMAVALGAYLADSGQRVVIVDCDTRRPAIHQILGAEMPHVGLTDLLGGHAKLDDVLRGDGCDRFAAISAGRPTARPQQLLGSKAMLSLLVELSERYDIIILDTPPVMSASDALILAPLADRVLFVVRWARTATSHANASLKQLREVGGRVSGAVLSMVNARHHANLEYGVRPPPVRPYLLRQSR